MGIERRQEAPSGIIDVTPSDTTEHVGVVAIEVWDAGDVAVVFKDGSTITWTMPNSLPFYRVCKIKKVMSTGTTAADINLFTHSGP